MKSSKFGIPIINVGNLSMGGTGKTPHVEHLIRLLKDDFKVATLSRGFGRVKRGFQIASDYSTALDIGDEPLQYYSKYGNQIKVAVDAERVLGAMDLFREHDDIQVLLLDDAYQHRKIHASFNILLTDYAHPFYKDLILPVGNLRESRSGKARADVIIVTKCPDLTASKKQELKDKIKAASHQKIFFSSINYGAVLDFSGNETSIISRNVILVTGIADAHPLIDELNSQVKIIKHFQFNDHHKFTKIEVQEIHKLFDKFATENPVILTTEKDAMRLKSQEFDSMVSQYPWLFQTIEVKIEEEENFNQLILKHVKENN